MHIMAYVLQVLTFTQLHALSISCVFCVILHMFVCNAITMCITVNFWLYTFFTCFYTCLYSNALSDAKLIILCSTIIVGT